MNNLQQSKMDYSLNFAVPIYFGPDALSDPNPTVLNGTGGLLQIGQNHFVITCHHVVDGYRVKKREQKRLLFQIGNIAIDPEDYLVDEDKKLDLAVFKLDEERAIEFKRNEPSLNFYNPIDWPPSAVTENDFIHFSGFPATWKKRIAFNGYEFRSLSSGRSEVISVFDHHLYSAISIDQSEISGDFTKKLDGMSGAPVFKWVERGGIKMGELIGVISEYQINLDRIRIAKIAPINKDGTVSSPIFRTTQK